MRCSILAIGLAASAHGLYSNENPASPRPDHASGVHGQGGPQDLPEQEQHQGPDRLGRHGNTNAFRGPKWRGEDGHSICDKYSADLFGTNNRDTQALLMTIFVNTAMAGNYTPVNNDVRVPGVVNPGSHNGKSINQMPWFNGELNSTNVTPDQGHGLPVNWLDGGGPAALHQNMTAFNRNSNQHFFILHLHEYFAYLLSCSTYGNQVDRYNGSTNMYHVHKYMDLNNDMQQYTNLQFVLSAKSLGFSERAQAYIGASLQWLFSFKCQKPISVPARAPPAPQSMCTGNGCPWFPGHPQCPEESVPKPVPVAAPNTSTIHVYNCDNDTEDVDGSDEGCFAAK